jgi:hypothetical protein
MMKVRSDSGLAIAQRCARFAVSDTMKRDTQLSISTATVDHMATCPDCKREKRLAPSCVTDFAVVVGEKTFERIRHPASAADRCDDCGVKPGGVHHFGCDMERCPSCGGQLIMCAG